MITLFSLNVRMKEKIEKNPCHEHLLAGRRRSLVVVVTNERLIALESTRNDTLRSINQSFLLFSSSLFLSWRSIDERDFLLSSSMPSNDTGKEIEYRSLLGDERASASLLLLPLLLLVDERMIKIDAAVTMTGERKPRRAPFFPASLFLERLD